MLFCVGPEKGFSQKELDILVKKQFHPASLNPYTLRAETAAITSLSILAHLLIKQSK